MIEALLQDATDALLAQQAEIDRLHRILAWCRNRVAAGEARQIDAMISNARAGAGGACRGRNFARVLVNDRFSRPAAGDRIGR